MMNWNGKTALVTGASGFVGSTLVRMLRERGATVVPLSRRAEPDAIQADLTDFASLTKALDGRTFDAVFHLAAAGVNPKEPVLSLIHVNAEGTENLLKALESLPVCPIVVAGSWTEYGASQSGVYAEDMMCAPMSAYGVSKLASTLFATSWSVQQRRPLTVLRLFSVYGPGEQEYRLGPAMIKAFREGRAPSIGFPDNTRDFVYVEDVADAFIRAVDLKTSGTILNVGTGIGTSIRAFVDEIRRAMGTAIEPIHGVEQPRPWDVPASQADVRRLEAMLAWKPMTSLEKGIERTLIL